MGAAGTSRLLSTQHKSRTRTSSRGAAGAQVRPGPAWDGEPGRGGRCACGEDRRTLQRRLAALCCPAFLRANPAASPPLPPPPQPPHKLYNGELLSLCYLTAAAHTHTHTLRLVRLMRDRGGRRKRQRDEKVGCMSRELAAREGRQERTRPVFRTLAFRTVAFQLTNATGSKQLMCR